jgi:hypothetical protein
MLIASFNNHWYEVEHQKIEKMFVAPGMDVDTGQPSDEDLQRPPYLRIVFPSCAIQFYHAKSASSLEAWHNSFSILEGYVRFVSFSAPLPAHRTG